MMGEKIRARNFVEGQKAFQGLVWGGGGGFFFRSLAHRGRGIPRHFLRGRGPSGCRHGQALRFFWGIGVCKGTYANCSAIRSAGRMQSLRRAVEGGNDTSAM